MSRHSNEQLVQHAREEKGHDLGKYWRHAAGDQRSVDVALHEQKDGLVPRSPVVAKVAAVPPVVVELAVAEAHDLGEAVEGGLEESKEAGEPAEEADG